MNKIDDIFEHGSLIHAVFSNSRSKEISKVEIRPIMVKDVLLYQVTEQREKKAIHRNVDKEACLSLIKTHLLKDFKQAVLFTTEGDFQLLSGKSGETKVLAKPPSKKPTNLLHNMEKKYLLPEDAPFLKELGLMNAQGRKKFKQINRFLEMVDDTLEHFQKDQTLHVIDFGCGKAYLTFALYYFLHFIKGFKVRMAGLDLKRDVIDYCSKLAEKLEYHDLKFSVGDIAAYIPESAVDMIVALHACDTATDAALAQGVEWKSQVILAAPCCQHELFKQVKSEPLKGILDYGLLKERFAAIATDAARAQILEMQGYSTQILEFIDPEDTPKNLLIRAVLGNSMTNRVKAKQQYEALKQSLSIIPKLETLL